MPMLNHDSLIFWHKREITDYIGGCNSALLPFCPPFIIIVKQAILIKPKACRALLCDTGLLSLRLIIRGTVYAFKRT